MDQPTLGDRWTSRAILAATLIEAKVVDISNVYKMNPAAADKDESIQRLKQAVDILLAEVVQK